MKLTKEKLKWLEKIFAAEIEGRLPFQSKAKILKQLEEDGLVLYDEEILPDPPGTQPWLCNMKIRGWYLTYLGRYLYCKSNENFDESILEE